jgi:putative membrane protein
MVDALNSISLKTIKSVANLFASGFKKESRYLFIEELKRIDALFLTILVAFAALSAMALSFLMEYLLAEQTIYTLSFFIGLIIPSIAVPWSMMEAKGWRLILVIPGIALTAGVGMAMPDGAAGNSNPMVAFASGAIAISAMILPGISGSFVLLVMGQYQNFIANMTGFLASLGKGEINITSLLWLAAFAVGMGVGILAFSRLLAILLKKTRSATMAFLIGLLLGSLFVLWPFKIIDEGAKVVDRHGEVKQDVQLATASNRLPDSPSEAAGAAFALLAGLGGSLGLISLGKRSSKKS